MSDHWQHRTDPEGNLWLGLDYAGGPVNLLASDVLAELGERVEALEHEPPKALVLYSRKSKGFIAGADVSEFGDRTDSSATESYIRRVHAILDRVEVLPCPTLALIDGFCLGGGLELALACRYRVATDHPSTRIGFPEVRLGIFPGFGGTWRAIRTVGPLAALQLMLSGRALRAKQAQRLGLVDLAEPRRQLEAAVPDLLRREPPPRRLGWYERIPGLSPLRPAFAILLRRRTGKHARAEHYPAPFALIDHWRECGSDRRLLLDSEARRVAGLLAGDAAQNLIRVFRLQERLKGYGQNCTPPRRLHLVGAGVMGGDIAAWAALRGQRVTIQDLSRDQLASAMLRARALFDKRLRDPRLVRDAWDRLMPDPLGDGLAQADLVIEAVVEDVGVKKALLAELERRLSEHALLAQGGWERMRERLATLERSHGGRFQADRGWRDLQELR